MSGKTIFILNLLIIEYDFYANKERIFNPFNL